MNVHDYKQVWNGLPLCIQNYNNFGIYIYIYMNTSFSTNSSKSLHSLLFDPSATHGVPSSEIMIRNENKI